MFSSNFFWNSKYITSCYGKRSQGLMKHSRFSFHPTVKMAIFEVVEALESLIKLKTSSQTYAQGKASENASRNKLIKIEMEEKFLEGENMGEWWTEATAQKIFRHFKVRHCSLRRKLRFTVALNIFLLHRKRRRRRW